MKTSKSNSFVKALVALFAPLALLQAIGQPSFQSSDARIEASKAGAAQAQSLTGSRPEKARMQKILKALIERCKTDAELVELMRKQRIMLQYTLDDLGMEFHFGFRDGDIVGDFGAPRKKAAEVHLSSTAEVFDSILLGHKELKEATIELNLSLIGKVKLSKAMPKIGVELKRLYKAACDESNISYTETPEAALAKN